MKYFYSVFLMIAFFSCGQDRSENNEILIIDPKAFPEEQISLSELADDIRYLPLDNTIPIGGIHSIEITAKSIYLSILNVGIVQYDKNGNFVHIIAKKGRGPGELQYGFDFAVDEEYGKVYIVDRNKIIIYSVNGAFLKEISTEKYFLSMAENIELIDSKIFLCDYGRRGDFRNHWIFLDTAGNLILKKVSTDHSTGWVEYGFSYKYENNIYYSNILNDTVFVISPDLKAKASFLFSKGEYRWPINYQLNTFEEASLFFRPGLMFESKHFIFLRYSYVDKWEWLIINKATKKMYQAFKNEKVALVNTIPGIINDLDSGIYAAGGDNVLFYSENSFEYIVSIINPLNLKALVASEEFKNSTPKYSEKKADLEKFTNSLQETDNPVLMFVQLKN